jgi:hypothetical protein
MEEIGRKRGIRPHISIKHISDTDLLVEVADPEISKRGPGHPDP